MLTDLLVTAFESVFHFVVSILLYIQFKIRIYDESEEQSFTQKCSEACFCVSIAVVLLLVVLQIRMVTAPVSTLEQPRVKDTFGFLWEGIRIDTKATRFFYLLFVGRRILMAVVLTTMQRWPGIVLQLCLLFNLLNMIFVVHVKPYSERSINRKEMINDYSILVCSTIMLTFTDFVKDLEVQNLLCGWTYIVFLMICILYNYKFLLSFSFRVIRLNTIRFNNHNCRWCIKKKKID